MTGEQLAEVDETLLLIAEAREQAERAARTIRREDGGPQLVEALQAADRSLLEVHGELRRLAYFGLATGTDQLELTLSG